MAAREGRILILGLGNPILGDDGVGIAIAREIKEHWPHDESMDFHEEDRGNPSSEHGEREGEAPTGLPVEGATRAPVVDIVEVSAAGRFLLDFIPGYRTVIVADAIMTDENAQAGSVYELSVDDLGQVVNPYASHALDLRTTVELGKQLGYRMPETIRIYAVEIKENTVFREGLSPEVEAAVQPVARKIMEELNKPVGSQP